MYSRVEELGLGDVFLFRGERYVVMANIINDHTPDVAHVVCGGVYDPETIYIFVLHTKFTVEKKGSIKLDRKVIEMTDEELATCS